MLRLLRRAVTTAVGRRAAVEALPAARAALRARRLLPAHVEQAREALADG